MRKTLLFVLALTLILASCKGGGSGKEGKARISNPEAPIKGKITLQLEEKFHWSPQDAGEEFYIIDFARGPDGSVFLLSRGNYKIYKIDREGRVVKVFSKKGEGPGEFKFLPKLKVHGNSLWVASSSKVAEFDLDGNLVREFRLKGSYRDIIPLGDGRFLASRLSFEEKTGERVSLLVIDAQDRILARLWDTDKTGFIHLKVGGKPFFFVSVPPILPVLLWDYSPETGLVYISEAEQYEVWVKDLQGKVRFLVSRQYKRIPFSEEEKEKFVRIYKRMPSGARKAVKKRLPDYLCSIFKLKALAHGYLLVMSVKEMDKLNFDLFDPWGKFLYQLEPPGALYDLFKVYGDGTVASLERDRQLYREYRVKNLPEVFGN